MKNKNDYWERREQEWIAKRTKKDQEYLKQMVARYDQLANDIQTQINSFYSKYATDTGLTMSDAIKKIKANDVQIFEKTAKKIVENKDFSKEANERLKLYNATMKINRLEYLKAQVGLELTKVTNQEQRAMSDYLESSYIDEVKRQSGILSKHNNVQTAKNARVVASASFHGAVWSDRLWVNQSVLKAKLDTVISRAMIQGTNPTQLIANLRANVAKEVKNATAVIENLVITETARVQDAATMRSLKAAGFKFCKWIAEPTACKYCLEIAERRTDFGIGVYPVDDAPMIPKHPRCRCSKSAHWVDKEKLAPGLFEKWFGKKKKEGPKEIFHDYPDNINDIVKKFVSDKNLKALGEQRAKEYAYRLSKAPEQYQKLFVMHKDKVEIADDISVPKYNNYFDPIDKKVHLMESAFKKFTYQNEYDLVYHEIAHAIDDSLKNISAKDKFKLEDTLRKEVVKGVEDYLSQHYPELKNTSRESKTFGISLDNGLFSKENIIETGNIADIYDGLAKVGLSFGHGLGYFDIEGKLASEFFAETVSTAINNSKAYEFQKLIAPKSTRFVNEIIEEVLKNEES